ncbi:D-alanine--D-alanine ligase [candidate division NPL-UPA2 bacterium Unc8]|uniref:D-alanine--D-alanine ligase n=1 Tax=candidate division NPL-UPA2 bacterium Unc8 TaxID=1980939 RepID=A0A399FUX8_UNCN2|nr:D-alanine--D-alanine ligase [Bacillota bacterium]RIH99756.1 MAG: D-alanine--D-alanine ligase [candidate division NPL-UPA2 bacterium Unc8]
MMRVAVLMGGKSSEREISLRSGKAVIHALMKKGMEVISLDAADNWNRAIKKKDIDVAFIALHGKYGEDGVVQSLLEKLNIPYTGSGVEASRVAFDKVCAKEIFLKENIPTPDFYILNGTNGSRVKGWHMEVPLVVKPARGGSAIGISIVKEEKEFQPALEKAIKYDSRVLIERYVKGKEITVGILNGTALPVVEIRSKRDFFDFEAKYTAELHEFIIPAPLEEEIYHRVQEISLQSHSVLGCSGFSRVDLILSGGETYVLEVNTIPGLTDVSLFPAAAEAAGIDFPELCQKIIEIALRGTKTVHGGSGIESQKSEFRV